MPKPNQAHEKFLDELAHQAGIVGGLINAADLIASNFFDHGETLHHGTKDATALRFLTEEACCAANRLQKMLQEGKADA